MSVSDAAWSPAEGDYSPEQWARACLIDTGEGDPGIKERYKLPVKEPSGTLNRNGVHAAAGRIHAVTGVSADKKAAAARKLVGIYRTDLGEPPPDALLNMAGESGGRSASPDLERLYVSHFNGYNTGSPIEVRSGGKGRKIGGYAAVFERMSENLGGFREKINPSFFDLGRSQGFPGVICRFNHQDMYLLGTTRSGTLQLNVDGVGLDYEVDLPESRGDVLELTQRGDLRHSSFAFLAYDEDWVKGDGGFPVRNLLSGKLVDVAPVTIPAYPDATVGLRSLARYVGAPIEDVIRLMTEMHERLKGLDVNYEITTIS